MKKVFSVLIATVVSTLFIGATVGAQVKNCDVLSINNTGTGSNNQVVCNVTTNVTVECNNNIYVLDSNSQTAASGAASSQGNVTAGTVVTGNATNSNGQTVAIGAACGTSAVATPTPTPTTPGQGSTTPTTPKALPNTASNSALTIIIGSLAAAAAVVVASRLAVATYRRIGSK